MAVHQESLKVIEKLMDKDPKKLNALDIAMANKHLLNIYEFFQSIDPVKDLGSELHGEKTPAKNETAKKPQKKENLGLFEINLFEGERESNSELDSDTPQPITEEVKNPVETKAIVREDTDVKFDKDQEKKSNPLVDDIKMEIREKPQNQEFVEESDVVDENITEETEEIESIELKESIETEEVLESSEKEILNKLSIAFEPPVSQEEWEPTQMSSIFDTSTKSGFTYVEEDLQLEKKQSDNFDIRNMIGLNDRYLYSNELFSDKKTYEKVLDQLNSFTTKEDAVSYLEPYLDREVGDIDEERDMDEVRMSFDKLLDSFYKK